MPANQSILSRFLRSAVPVWLALAALSIVQAAPNGWQVTHAPRVRRYAVGGRFSARSTLEKGVGGLHVQPGARYRIIVKFQDDVTPRVNRKEKTLTVARGNDILAPVLTKHDLAFEPLLKLPEEALVNLEHRAARRSGRAQPDLAGILIAHASDEGGQTALRVAGDLAKLSIVEYVELVDLSNPPPPPGDIAPTTPDLTSLQGYHNPNPGIDAAYAWGRSVRGSGIRVSDCEYGFNTNHEDLVDEMVTTEPGRTMHPSVIDNGWDSHGTAALGEMASSQNAYGMTGLASDAHYCFFSEWTAQYGYSRTAAIANAIAGSSAGDIVTLEMQTVGAGGAYSAAEYSLSVWTLVKTATDAGILVVAAAGNGNEDMDSAAYATYRARGDSGAIIVGAGSANTSHDKLSFSTYGNRVNVQGWGESVATLGYGAYAEYGGDKNQRYVNTFGGTSSATPIVASACTLIQSYCQNTYGFRLGPMEMRQLLIDTGVAQGEGGHIGPLPDVRAAILYLDGDSDGDTMPTWWELKNFTNGVAALPTADADSDGQDNISEWIAFTDPTNTLSFFSIGSVLNTGGHSVLRWNGHPERRYTVQWSSNLLLPDGGFTGLTSGIPGSLPENVYTDTLHTAEQPSFYRLSVTIP